VTITVLVQPRDPILIRDGRPFSAEAGAAARSLEWPMPGTAAGALRTCIGNAADFDWTKDGPKLAKAISLIGALPFVTRHDTGEVFLPRPSDAVFFRKEGEESRRLMCLRPTDDYDGGVYGFEPGLWHIDSVIDWLASAKHDSFEPVSVANPPSEIRTHVAIDRATGAAAQGMLFSAEMRVLNDTPFTPRKSEHETSSPSIGLLCRLSSEPGTKLTSRFLTFGGERRVAYVDQLESDLWPIASSYPKLVSALTKSKRIRLQVVTPALFTGGWRPGWLNQDGIGAPPGLPSLQMKLVGAICGRALPVSGWDMDKSAKKPGPKPARYAAPSGAVYFFELLSGSSSENDVEQLFLSSISDKPEDRADGFGLALPGIW
jgi:CRISPR-associated protein Cmr3